MASNTDILTALVEQLHDGKNGAARGGAAKGLGIIGGEVARRELLRALQSARTGEEAGVIAEALGQATLN